MPAKRSEYQNKPVLVLSKTENDRFPFTFGLNKAKMILENIDAIREFVEECSTPSASEE